MTPAETSENVRVRPATAADLPALTAIYNHTLPNDSSVALHTHFGYTLTGVMHGIGRKLGRYWDVAWYEKRLDEPHGKRRGG